MEQPLGHAGHRGHESERGGEVGELEVAVQGIVAPLPAGYLPQPGVHGGVVDQIDAPARPSERGELRVTDHKTGKNRTKSGMVVGGGETLQPVLYGLAVKQALGRPVSESQLFFATAAGRYERRVVRMGEEEERKGIEVLEVIDRAIETGVLVPAPRERACEWCDFQPVCGPWEERRIGKKDRRPLSDLLELRSRA